MLRDESPTKEVKATIIHEICHTVEGCFNHSSPWLSKIEIYRQNSNNPSYYDEDIKKVQAEINKLKQLLIELENK